MSTKAEFQRFASPFERRLISREALGLYHAVIIGAQYEFPAESPLDSPHFFFHPLKCCIEQHPYLSVVVNGVDTETPSYQRVQSIDLQDHISIAQTHGSEDDELATIKKILLPALDQPFTRTIPPWRTIIAPLRQGRCFIAFAFSHAIGDGLSGVSFHRTFLEACSTISSITPSEVGTFRTPNHELPGPFDTPERLPISWSFLLMPLIGHFLPRFVTKLLGIEGSLSNVDVNTWTGSYVANDPKESHTKMKLVEIEAPLLGNALRESRIHDTKLTGLIHQFISRALSRAINDPGVTNFVAQTTLNMRASIGISSHEMGNVVSGCYTVHKRLDVSDRLSEPNWEDARTTARQLAECAATLQDQPIGLLRYVSGIRNWTLGKFGQQRDCSYEVSNVGLFDSYQQSASTIPEVRVSKLVFTQPGHVSGPALAFSFASVKDGSLVYTVTWQVGALAVEDGDEEKFVADICSSIRADFEGLSS